LRELAKIGFSDIRKAMSLRNEMVARKEEGDGEDGVVRVTRVLLRVLTAKLFVAVYERSAWQYMGAAELPHGTSGTNSP
jgi:hypothetical protein